MNAPALDFIVVTMPEQLNADKLQAILNHMGFVQTGRFQYRQDVKNTDRVTNSDEQ